MTTIRSQALNDLSDAAGEVRRLRGWPTASVRRLVSSKSDGIGMAPTDVYASGLTDLPVIAKLHPTGEDEGPIASTTRTSMSFEFFNVEVIPGDEIVFEDRVYRVTDALGQTTSLVLGEVSYQSGTVVLDRKAPPEEPVGVRAVVRTKPAAEVSFKVEYADQNGEEVVSDPMLFPGGCSVGDWVTATKDGKPARISEVLSIEEFAGELGAGVLRLSDDCPSRIRVLGVLKSADG